MTAQEMIEVHRVLEKYDQEISKRDAVIAGLNNQLEKNAEVK